MTAIDIFINQAPSELLPMKQPKNDARETDAFRSLLSVKISSVNKPVSEEKTTKQLTELANMIPGSSHSTHNEWLNVKEVLQKIDGPLTAEELIAELSKDQVSKEILEEVFVKLSDQDLSGSLLQDLTTLFDRLELSEEEIKQIISLDTRDQKKLEDVNEQIVFLQFSELFGQVHSLLGDIQDELDVIKVAPKLLQLIEKWVNLENAVSKEALQTQRQLILPEVGTREQSIWKELIQAYEKRNQLVTHQQYHSDAKVTSKDISKWLTTALQVSSTTETSNVSQSALASNTLMTELEQYVIHINQAKGTPAAGKQLMEQFQHVLKTSRFLSNNGVNQLTIALRPNNMGELVVRLTEINGEMTVKIITSSSMTRQMLESNIHELRHMFSPHQVVIEEQELETQDIHKELRDETLHDDEDNQPNHSNKDNKQDSEDDFETRFLNLLMNEKV